jgi:hypothetical protein
MLNFLDTLLRPLVLVMAYVVGVSAVGFLLVEIIKDKKN